MLKRILIPLAFVGLIVSGPAMALTGVKLTSASPADGATVPAPHEISLSFDEPVQLINMSLTHAGKSQKLDVSRVRNAMTLKVPLKDLEPGAYTVRYNGMARSSGHFVSGTINFTVAND